MARERDFVVHGENPNLRVVRRILRRQHKGRLGIIEFGRDRLHLRGREPAGVEHHGKRIAAESTVGENVHGDITPLHLRSPVLHQVKHDADRFVKRSQSLRFYPSCHTVIGWSYPLIATSPSGTALLPVSPIASRIAADTKSCELKSLLSDSSRAAKFTVSPITVYSLRRGEPTLPATTAPMWIPMPIRSFHSCPSLCCAIAASISCAAATARAAASGSAIGAPNSARKPSPRNLFTMPPWRSRISTSTAKASSSRATTFCGVRERAAAVKLRKSTNITATSRVSLAAPAPARNSRSTTCGETCWPNRFVTRSRAVAARMLASNWRRSCIPTAPASPPQTRMTRLRTK